MQADLDSVGRNREHPGNLRRVKVLDVPQEQNRSMDFRQLIDATPDHLTSLASVYRMLIDPSGLLRFVDPSTSIVETW
jgi:hypothetical protein